MTLERFSRTRGGDPWRLFWHHVASFVFPAHAGVILIIQTFAPVLSRFSRTRGGDPIIAVWYEEAAEFFPHTRG